MSMDRIEYNETAPEYARCRRADRAVVERLIAGSGIGCTSRVLEVGCGTGNYISEIRQRVGCECWGVDPSPEMIGQARQGSPDVAYGVASAEHLGGDDGAFDFSFSVDVVHHVADRAAYFREAARVLRRGGLLATVTDSEDTIRRRMPLAVYFPETVEVELRRYPPLADLRRLSEQAGLELTGEEVVETPYQLTDLEPFRGKAFSCLRLIGENAFAAGTVRMERDLENGAIACVSRNYIIWSRKS